MINDYKIEDQLADKKSEGSCKLSKTKRIKKVCQKIEKTDQKPERNNQKTEKKQQQKQKTPKITNFFKKLAFDNIQRPYTSSQKKQLKRSPQEQQRIEELHAQSKELQHVQEMLKKQIYTIKSQQQLMHDQFNSYMKKARQIQITDLRQRYEIIRCEKFLPQYRKIQFSKSEKQSNSNLNTPQMLNHRPMNSRTRYLQQQILIKKQLLNKQHPSTLHSFQKYHIQQQITNLQTKLRFTEHQAQIHTERSALAHKQKSCKFALLNWPVINKKYQILQLIGAGGYSQVYKSLNIPLNLIVAIKLCSVTEMAQVSSELYLKHLLRECQTHKKLDHSNIVRLYEVIQLDKMTFCLVLEYCQGPELSKYMKRKGPLKQIQAKGIMFQIFQTLYYLNNFSAKKIIHYDLKPQNIMFDKGVIKILDFGLNKQIDEQQSRAALTSVGMGTDAYLPPQIHECDQEDEKVLTSKVDIWSAGTIFYELLYGKRPSNSCHIKTVVRDNKSKIQASKTDKPSASKANPQSPIQTTDISNEFQTTIITRQTIEIIKKCLKLSPQQRISPQQIYFHPYFDQFGRKYTRLSQL